MQTRALLLATVLALLATGTAQAQVGFDLYDSATCDTSGIASDGTLDFNLGNLIAGNTCKVNLGTGVVVRGTINYGTGSAPGSGTTGAAYHIALTDLLVLNPGPGWLADQAAGDGFFLRFVMPTGLASGPKRTYTLIDGTYEDADGDGIVEAGLYTRMNGSISYGASITNAALGLGSDVADGTPFFTASALGSNFNPVGTLVAQFFMRVPAGAGFEMPGSAIVEVWDADTTFVPLPGAALLVPAAIAAILPFRRRRRE